MKKCLHALVAAALAVTAAACIGIEHKTTVTGPSNPSSLAALLGNWTSSSVLPSAQSCSNFQWNVTDQQGSTASGTFSATCPGNLTLAGTAHGTLLGNTVTWTADGNATAPGLPSCAFSLTGTAVINGSQIRVPYTGQTCLGAVQGEETLNRS
jgi:hypothetical protein